MLKLSCKQTGKVPVPPFSGSVLEGAVLEGKKSMIVAEKGKIVSI